MKKVRLIVALAFVLSLSSLAFAGGPNDVRREDRQQDKNAQQNDKHKDGKDDPANHDANDDNGVDLIHQIMNMVRHMLG